MFWSFFFVIGLVFQVGCSDCTYPCYECFQYVKDLVFENPNPGEKLSEDHLITLDTATLITDGLVDGLCENLRFWDTVGLKFLGFMLDSKCDDAYTRIWITVGRDVPYSSVNVTLFLGLNDTISGCGTTLSDLTTGVGKLANAAYFYIPFLSSCTTGWEDRSSEANQHYIRLGSSFEDTVGTFVATIFHTHTVTGRAFNQQGGGGEFEAAMQNSQKTNSGGFLACTYSYNTKHEIEVTSTVSTAKPPSIYIRLCRSRTMDLHANQMHFFDGTISLPYTEHTDALNKFPYISSSLNPGETGGEDTHAHSIQDKETDGLQDCQGPQRVTDGGGGGDSKAATNTHTHIINADLDAVTNIPEKYDFKCGKAAAVGANQDLDTSFRILADVIPPKGYKQRETGQGKFLRCASAVGGETASHATTPRHSISNIVVDNCDTQRTVNAADLASCQTTHSHSYFPDPLTQTTDSGKNPDDIQAIKMILLQRKPQTLNLATISGPIPICGGVRAGLDQVCSGRGTCNAPNQCICDDSRWKGDHCEIPTLCFGKAHNLDIACGILGGICLAPNVCDCNATYWSGSSCTIPKCFGVLSNESASCSAHGSCVEPDHCNCNTSHWGTPKWASEANCSFWKCFGKFRTDKEVCGGHGDCVEPDVCVCTNSSFWDSGLVKKDCSEAKCFGVLASSKDAVCSAHGTCVKPDRCECNSTFWGTPNWAKMHNCSMPKCFGKFASEEDVCSGHGICVKPDTCVCNDTFWGTPTWAKIHNCSIVKCFGVLASEKEVCSGHGNCVDPDRCICDNSTLWDSPSWAAKHNCSMPKCFGKFASDLSVCSGNGYCSDVDHCICTNSSWWGDECQSPKCFGVQSNDYATCSGHGVCTAPDRCICNSTFWGTPEWASIHNCSMPKCFGRFASEEDVCSGHGYCSDADHCICSPSDNWGTPNWAKMHNCSMPKCFGKLASDENVCYGHGYCKASTGKELGKDNECVCVPSEEWGGLECFFPKCYGLLASDATKSIDTACGGKNRGTCTKPDTCSCNDTYWGNFADDEEKDCRVPKCDGKLRGTKEGVCNDRGSCLENLHVCDCNEKNKWGGNFCEKPKCNGKMNGESGVCSGRGTCKEPDLCECFQSKSRSWGGENCDTPKCFRILEDNVHTPCHGFTCEKPDVCGCPQDRWNRDCSHWTCNGIERNMPEACTENFECINSGPDNFDSDIHCSCPQENYTEFCDEYKCGIYGFSHPEVCNARGNCTDIHQCLCEENSNLYGENCDELVYEPKFLMGENGELSNTVEISFFVHVDLFSDYGKGMMENMEVFDCDLILVNNMVWEAQNCSFNLLDTAPEYTKSLQLQMNMAKLNPKWEYLPISLISISGHDIDLSGQLKNPISEKKEISDDPDNNNTGNNNFPTSVLVIMIVVPLLCACLGVILICVVLGLVVYQRKKLKKFDAIDGIDILLREQEAEKEFALPKVRVDKAMFEIEYSDLKLEETIASGGSMAVVYRGKYFGADIAFKCFRCVDVLNDQKKFNDLEREIAILSSVRIPGIIDFIGAVLSPPKIGIVMPFCVNGDLKNFLTRHKAIHNENFDMEKKIDMLLQIAQTMAYLHGKNIIHRDLKPENCLIMGGNEKEEKLTVKLMDFGLSRFIEVVSKAKTVGIGTSIYVAPEITLGCDYSNACDVFSFGIMVYVVIAEDFCPYKDVTTGLEFHVAQNEYFRPNLADMPQNCPKWIKRLAKTLWSANPEERYSFSTIAKMIEGAMSEQKPVCVYVKKEGMDDSEADDLIIVEKTLKEFRDVVRKEYFKIEDENEGFVRIFGDSERDGQITELLIDEDVKKIIDDDLFVVKIGNKEEEIEANEQRLIELQKKEQDDMKEKKPTIVVDDSMEEEKRKLEIEVEKQTKRYQNQLLQIEFMKEKLEQTNVQIKTLTQDVETLKNEKSKEGKSNTLDEIS